MTGFKRLVRNQPARKNNSAPRLMIIMFTDRAQGAQNMPVGLQVLGRRLQEEQVLAMGQAIMEALDRTD